MENKKKKNQNKYHCNTSARESVSESADEDRKRVQEEYFGHSTRKLGYQGDSFVE